MKNVNEAVRDIFSALIAIIISFAVYKVLGQLVKDTLSNLYVANFAGQLIFAIPVFFAVILLKKTEIYRSDPKKLKASWTAGIMFLIISLLSVVRIISNGIRITAGPLEILLFLMQMFLVGYCEETLYRGLLQNALHRYLGERSLSSVRIAVFIAGTLFGVSHLLNALHPGIGFATAAVQSVGAAAMGWCMCAVYYRTGKCLWFLIALHALNDAVLMIEQGILAGASEAEVLVGSTGTGLVRVVVPVLFYGLIALFLLRRKKLEPLIQDNR